MQLYIIYQQLMYIVNNALDIIAAKVNGLLWNGLFNL